MADGVLAALEKEFKPLSHPKLLAEAKALHVVWARVKGYPAWPAQVLTEAAALRRKDLGQERHSKGNSVPVMFFGTVEVAWVKDADIVDFKEGLYQGFFDRKTKPFKLALEQVCEYLALDRKRKAPPKWWCKPPPNGHDDGSDGPAPKVIPAPGSGAAKGIGQRHDASKASRQKSAAPETESGTSPDEDGAAAAHAAGKKGAGKAAGGKDGDAAKQAKEAAAPAAVTKPRDSSTGRLPRDNGSTAASTNTAAQAPPKKPPTVPLNAPSRQQAALKEALPAGDANEVRKGVAARQAAPTAAADAKAAPPSQTSQQQRLRSNAGPSLSAKENDAGLPPRKRPKLETAPGAVGPVAGSASSLPPPSSAAGRRAISDGEETGELDAVGMSEVDVLKLPAEIRRLAGIRLPAIPKKPGLKEESARLHLPVKAEQAAASTAAKEPVGAPKQASVAGISGGAARPRRSSNTSTRAGGQAEGGRQGAATRHGKRSRKALSSTGEDSPSAESSDEEEEGQSSGEEADSEAAASSSSDESSDASEEESEDDMAVRRGGKAAVSALARGQGTRSNPNAQAQPARDRKGEKQRRLARLAAPEPANRRTSARLVPKADPQLKKDISEDLATGSSEDESEAASDEESEDEGEGVDERASSAAGGSSSESEEEPVAKGSGGHSADLGIQLRITRTRAAQAVAVQPQRPADPSSRKAAGGGASRGPIREASEPADQRPKANSGHTDADIDGYKKQQRREGGGVAAAPVVRALPLELRRLQNSPSGGPPAVDTSEPRTLRDRPSPARRVAASTGVTPTPTATAGGYPVGKRAERRGSEDGSGASMSPVGERARSPEHRRDGQKAPTADARVPPKLTRSQVLDGRSSKASSVAGSASPPPAPVTGGVPVRKKPASLGVPSTARSAGQAGARQLPAITPARAVLRSLASTSEALPAGALPASGCAGTSDGGGLLAPVAVCVPKKPSCGPPTRRLAGPGLDAPVSSTDLPDVASLDCEADAKHASSPDVAAADATVASGGPLPRSPDAVSVGDAGPGTPEERPSTSQHAEVMAEQRPGVALQQPKVQDMLSDLGLRRIVAAGVLLESGERHSAEEDLPMAEERPTAAGEEPGPASVEEAVAAAEAMDVLEQAANELPQQQELVEPQLGAAEAIKVRLQSLGAPVFQLDATAIDTLDRIEPQPSSCCQQATARALSGPDAVEELPVLATRSSVAHDEEYGPTSRSPAQLLSAPGEMLPVAGQQELSAHGPQALCEAGSPLREEALLAEEQLPDQGEAMAEHDGRAAALAEPLVADCSGNGFAVDPSCAGPVVFAAAEVVQALTASSPIHTAAVKPLEGHAGSVDGALAEQPSLHSPCAGSRANSEAGGGDGAPGGASGASCSVQVWGEDDDAAARARARELEELGEVAAALAGLQRAEVPRPPLNRSASQPASSHQQPVAMQLVDSLLDRGRGRGQRGSTRSTGSWDILSAQNSGPPGSFRWPQPEPLLPAQDQPFALPRDWLMTRPPRYEPVKRNLWLSRAKPKRLPRDEINICACRPPPFAAPGELQRMGCGPNCLNRLSSILCDAKLCPCGELCSNRSLHLLRQPKTEVFLTEDRGWGVRAMEPLSKGAFIIEYAGEVIDERELGRRMDHARMNGEPHFYIMELSAGLYIDARRKGNIARLINSSCDPNCETQKWHDASTGEVRVGIFSTRDIAPGEELVYDYFFSTYGAVKQSAASFVCMCGSKNCRGTMDLHPEKRRDLGRRVEVFWDADGQYYRAVIVAYHPTSKKHTIMYEDGGTEKLCLDEVPHRWMEDDQPRSCSTKSDAPRGEAASAAQPVPAELAQPLPEQQELGLRDLEQGEQRQQAMSATDLADLVVLADRDGGVHVPTVASHPPPRPLVPIDQRCLLPPLGNACMGTGLGVVVRSGGQLGKHGHSDSELNMHLPLKKRQRMMQHLPQPLLHRSAALPSLHSNTLSASGRAGEAHHPGIALPQTSGGSAGCVTAPASGPIRYSGGGADSADGDANGLSGRTSLRLDASGTGSGRVSSVAAEEDDPNEDLDSLLEAAEAVAALRTAPISGASALHAQQQDAALPLQPRHVRIGSLAAGGAGAVAMVQTAKVASPRHLAIAHRTGPPNGLPPHGGSRPSGTATAHPSSSSSGFIPYQLGGSRQHASANGNSHGGQGGQHDGGHGGPYDLHQHSHGGRNGRFSGDLEGGLAAGGGGGRGRNGNGYSSQPNGDINREDLLWKLVGIDKPKDLLPLFSGGCEKSRNGDQKGRRTGSDSWIAPSHPYGKLLRALEASELLPQADQFRLYAQQHQQQQHAPHHQQHEQAPQVTPPQLPAPQTTQQAKQAQPGAVAGSATPAEALALTAWQQLAQQQAQHEHQQHTTIGTSYAAHGYDSGTVVTSVAAFLQQQHAAAAAAAVAASSGQAHNLHALQGVHTGSQIAAAATAASGAAAGAGGLSGHHASQQALAAASAVAHWPQPLHGQPSSILHDLVHMYVAQHAAGSHPMLATAGTMTVGGSRV